MFCNEVSLIADFTEAKISKIIIWNKGKNKFGVKCSKAQK